MEQLLGFIWGIITVVYVMMGVVMVQMRKSVKELEVQLSGLQQNISDLHRIIDEKEYQNIGYVDNLSNNNQSQIDEIFRQMDSRFDKMENKISKEITVLHTEIDKLDSKSPDLLKG